ncbi:MAG: DUF86 domain-containing protein [Heyndrickxia sp.]
MYFVDRDKIEETLQYFENKITLLQSNNNWDDEIGKLALERISHMLIESILDVGNAIIDGFIMRDPGSYEDILDILTDEKVITDDMSKSLLKLILYRKILVQQYLNVNPSDLLETVKDCTPSLEEFPKRVRDYLTNELGPVSAFKS